MSISGTTVLNKEVVFANSALQDTKTEISVKMPGIIKKQYLVNVLNPSTVTDLTLQFMTDVNGAKRYLSSSKAIPKASTVKGNSIGLSFVIEGVFVNSDLLIVVTNDTALGSDEGFTAEITVKEME